MLGMKPKKNKYITKQNEKLDRQTVVYILWNNHLTYNIVSLNISIYEKSKKSRSL